MSPIIGTLENDISANAPYIDYFIVSFVAIFACYSLEVETKGIVLDDPKIYKLDDSKREV